MFLTPRLPLFAALLAFGFSSYAMAADFSVKVEGIKADKPVPAAHALCVPTADHKSGPGKNARPDIRWANAPAGTKSFAVFMMDPDVPADFADAGKDGKTIAQDAKRQDFFHYGVVNIPADATELRGGDSLNAPQIGTQLTNDLGSYVKIPGQFGGPCPPWNDLRLHHYHFVVFALDEAMIDSHKSAKNAYKRLNGSKHVLARASVVGTYTLNAAVRP